MLGVEVLVTGMRNYLIIKQRWLCVLTWLLPTPVWTLQQAEPSNMCGSRRTCVCECVFEHSWEDPEWIKADDTPGRVLLREPAVRSGIRDQRRLFLASVLALRGVCHCKLALSQRDWWTFRLDLCEMGAVKMPVKMRPSKGQKVKQGEWTFLIFSTKG